MSRPGRVRPLVRARKPVHCPPRRPTLTRSMDAVHHHLRRRYYPDHTYKSPFNRVVTTYLDPARAPPQVQGSGLTAELCIHSKVQLASTPKALADDDDLQQRFHLYVTAPFDTETSRAYDAGGRRIGTTDWSMAASFACNLRLQRQHAYYYFHRENPLTTVKLSASTIRKVTTRSRSGRL